MFHSLCLTSTTSIFTTWQTRAFNTPFNNMRTLKFKAQPTCAFLATVNQMFGGSSQLPTTAEHCFVVWTVLDELITAFSAVVGSWEEPPSIWLTVAKNAFVGWALNFRVRMLLKGAVNTMSIAMCRPHGTNWPWRIKHSFRILTRTYLRDFRKRMIKFL